jgi:hypothetical protein
LLAQCHPPRVRALVSVRRTLGSRREEES